MVYERSKVNQIMEQKSLHADSKELEKEHVHDVYKHIAVHFSETRYKPWPRVATFNGLYSYSTVYDNNKYAVWYHWKNRWVSIKFSEMKIRG